MFRNRDVFRQIGRVALGEALCVGLMLGVYALLGKFTLPVLWGGLLGGALSILNFVFLCIAVTRAADRAVATGEAGRAKLSVQGSSVLRLAVLAVVLIVVLKAGMCDPLAAILPLLFLEVSVNVTEFFRKEGDRHP